MSAADPFATIARLRAEDSVIVEESPSNLQALHKHLPTRKPLSFFTMASGGLGCRVASVWRWGSGPPDAIVPCSPLLEIGRFSTRCSRCGRPCSAP